MKRKRYMYAISYFYSQGVGCSQFTIAEKINSIDAFSKIRKTLAEEFNVDADEFVIINIMYLGVKRW